jgi:hypothetical protein
MKSLASIKHAPHFAALRQQVGRWLAALACTAFAGPAALHASSFLPAAYTGLCDASAVVALDADHFAVGDDEDNVIRVYGRAGGGQPVASLELSAFLRTVGKSREVDIEGVARLDGLVYWISSHGRNVDGKWSPNRQRFFATTGSVSNGLIDLRPAGQPYSRLLLDLLRDPRLEPFNLERAASLPPKAPGALNIEGLALLNPAEVIQGRSARLGEPQLLDLDGRGVRSITLWHGKYVLIAGSSQEGGQSRLYVWDGGADKPRWLEGMDFGGLNPEAISFYNEAGQERLYVVSDDGTRKVGGKDCKKLKNPNLKQFRALCLTF